MEMAWSMKASWMMLGTAWYLTSSIVFRRQIFVPISTRWQWTGTATRFGRLFGLKSRRIHQSTHPHAKTWNRRLTCPSDIYCGIGNLLWCYVCYVIDLFLVGSPQNTWNDWIYKDLCSYPISNFSPIEQGLFDSPL
jgi:hypothetical protein